MKKINTGDTIRLTKPFVWEDLNGDKHKEKSLSNATVIDVFKDFIMVDFGKEYEFTTPLDERIITPTCCALDKKDVEVVIEDGLTSKTSALFSLYKKRKINQREEKNTIERKAKETYKELVATNNALKRLREEYDNDNKKIKDFSKEEKSLLNKDAVIRKIKKLEKNKLIKNVIVENEHIYVVTKNMELRDEKYTIKGMAYVMKISIINPTNVNVINYKKFLNSEYGHPCVSNVFSLCLGSSLPDRINALYKQGDYVNIIMILLSSLQEPGTSHPYIKLELFKYAQNSNLKVDIKNINEIFKNGYNKSLWDSDKYNKAFNNS